MCAEEARATLVLADDNKALAGVCRQLLGPEFEVLAVVHGGRDAVDAVDHHDPDILVLDIGMPDMSGVEVIESLRTRSARTRVVVLTVHQESALAGRVMDLGAYGYVVKSRMARDLLTAIRAALSGERFRSPLKS